MMTYGYVLPGAVSLVRWAIKTDNLSDKAKQRLKVLDWLRVHNNNISLAARHFGSDRKTIRSWLNKFKRMGPVGLNDRSHRPKNVRSPETPWEIVSEVIKIRKRYPAWSKYKIRPLLPNNLKTSASNIGRILKRKGLIDVRISRKRSKSAKNPKARFPQGLKISNPGDMIQMDTKHVNLIGGRKLYQFTAIDVLTKQRILNYHPSLASKNGASFLKECVQEFPFEIKMIQTDNGSEFLKEFDKFCKEIKMPHYFIYPRHPKQNSYVEISHGADKREFYQQGNVSSDIEIMRKRIKEWQNVWNNIRPHQALNYLTPRAYYEKWQRGRLPTKDIITLQT